MNKKVIWGIIIILVIVGAVLALAGSRATAPTTDEIEDEVNNQYATSTASTTPNNTDATEDIRMNGEIDIGGDIIEEIVIIYTDSGFSPKDVAINLGQTVIFRNESSRDFWPASNDHPIHNIDPEFDPKKRTPTGSDFSYKFPKVGTWGYHNHLRAGEGGTITVK
ncbi:MAG: hypothetical protein A2928_01630 [Candidatus Taylorbacteria bacterium RIFCSPLOWO2_01_FULL_45_15b]|uniref:EfeO-type cupredoxin-like domain-containing protein n=1 Tax=Candidatus Taylorbacteria bacterium RIFCSPLOWO2_01_FULL_45_15b TaxID=1802319 RepID=A0A1G2N8Q9_9BACT|nr:MAG: hypothetical protein A2928_01630 [Candidatus Taylorbacteria bacterium RIFCSPLOWO2_01_FULL_45_15b]